MHVTPTVFFNVSGSMHASIKLSAGFLDTNRAGARVSRKEASVAASRRTNGSNGWRRTLFDEPKCDVG